MVNYDEANQIQFENECKIAIENGRDRECLLAQILLWCSTVRGDPDLVQFAFSKGASVDKPMELIIYSVLKHYKYITVDNDIIVDPDSVQYVENIRL